MHLVEMSVQKRACLMVDWKAVRKAAWWVYHLVGLKDDQLADCLERMMEWNLVGQMALLMVVPKGRNSVEHSVHLKAGRLDSPMADLKVDLMVAQWGSPLAAS
jgi:hypothetical protein